jgi:hypothetical protein
LNKIKWLRKSKIPSKFHQKLNQLGKKQMGQIPVETVTKAIWQVLLAQDDSTESRRVFEGRRALWSPFLPNLRWTRLTLLQWLASEILVLQRACGQAG